MGPTFVFQVFWTYDGDRNEFLDLIEEWTARHLTVHIIQKGDVANDEDTGKDEDKGKGKDKDKGKDEGKDKDEH
jgi:hypothetical protein